MTIKDIAKLSGYGIGTVSRVLNNHPDVSKKARESILKIIEETGYQPNSNAKLLKLQTSSSILIIVKGSKNLLFAGILEEIENRLSMHDEDAHVSYIDEDSNEVLHALTLCRERNPKAIIFLGGNLEYFKESFSEIKVPSVLLTNTAKDLNYPNLSSFTTDDREASMRVIDYLIEKGHRNIGIIGGNLSNTQISYSRIQGGLSSLDSHGLPFELKQQYEPCRFSLEEGYKATKRLLDRTPSLTGIFALSDVIAMGAMRAILDLGKRIPEDISIVGYDGIALSDYCSPRLTTISQDTETMAKECVDYVLKSIHYTEPAVHQVITFELSERESVKEV